MLSHGSPSRRYLLSYAEGGEPEDKLLLGSHCQLLQEEDA